MDDQLSVFGGDTLTGFFMNIREKIHGGVMGHIIGNALGHRCVTDNVKTPSQILISQLLARNYTEAGSMTLCSMASINEFKDIIPSDIAEFYHEWYLGSYLSSPSETRLNDRIVISQSMRNYGNGMPVDRCGSNKDDESDSSALIRIMPIAIWLRNCSLQEMITKIEEVTKFTNRQIPALVCSNLYALLIRGILLERKEKIADILENYYKENSLIEHHNALKDVINAKSADSTKLVNLFWTMWKIYADERNDYEKAILQAFQTVENYEDIGCLVGSLVGLTAGITGIPSRWVEQIDLPPDGERTIQQFVNLATKEAF
jgi:ADP-ribosylglycohydrolase